LVDSLLFFYYFLNQENKKKRRNMNVVQLNPQPLLNKDGSIRKKMGRPLKFKTPEELQAKIDAYFDSCFEPILNKDNEIVRDDQGKAILRQTTPFTITGLAVFLDVDRVSLLDYSERVDFSHIIARAKAKCENFAEKMLFNRDSARGAQFVLNTSYKNWIERREIETKNENITTVKQQIDLTKLSKEDIIALSDLYKRAAIEQNIIEDAQIIEETPCTEAIASDSQNRENVPE
jgi:hypothetical protein